MIGRVATSGSLFFCVNLPEKSARGYPWALFGWTFLNHPTTLRHEVALLNTLEQRQQSLWYEAGEGMKVFLIS
jgi:hypothetical protein